MTAQQAALRVWCDGSNYVIAADRDDARACLHDHVGGDLEDYAEEALAPVNDDKTITIWCNATGDPDEVDGDGNEPVDKTAAEWAKRGRGFLCSEDF